MVNAVFIFRYSAIIRKFLVKLLSKSFKEHCLFEKKKAAPGNFRFYLYLIAMQFNQIFILYVMCCSIPFHAYDLNRHLDRNGDHETGFRTEVAAYP